MEQFSRALAGFLLAATLTGSAAFGGGTETIDVRIREVVPTSAAATLATTTRAIELTVGFADLLGIEGSVSTIVLGDPNIADASPLDAGTILLTGRTAGTTNMIVLDESGGVLADLMLYVSSRQPGTVTVHRALNTQVYSCASGLCEGSSAQDAGGTASPAAPALASSSQ